MKPAKMDLHTTFVDGGWTEKFQQSVLFAPGDTENRVINLYPEAAFQTFEGFGGALTQAAGYVYSQMDQGQRRKLLDAYFSPARMNYQFVRIPIDSCDFSTGEYEGFGQVEKYILPMLRDAERWAGRKIPVMLSPWSPPARMKTNGSRQHGGLLRQECRGEWAEYLCQYVRYYLDQGFEVTRMTLQNEPKAVQTWDSCIFTAREEKEFLRDYMWPAMEKHGLTDIELYIWDHNKERVYEWLRDIVDADTDRMVAGAAFHWYSGDHFEALDLCREKFPHKKLMVSESAVEYRTYGADNAPAGAFAVSHEVMGDLNHGACAFCDWNLLLDEKGGPNYVGNYCLAPFLYDTGAKQLLPQLLALHLEHFSHAIVPGSVRVASTGYSRQVEHTAWRRPDGSIVLILLNNSGEVQPVHVRVEDREAGALLYPRSISSAVIT